MNNTHYRGEKIHHKIHRHAHAHVYSMRQKSDFHKKVYAFSVSFTVTLIVFMLWYFLSLPKILEKYNINKSEAERLGDNPIDKIKNIFKGSDFKNNEINTEMESNLNNTNIQIIQ